ncbi:MAG: hypothetical protein R2867_05455 [Caldilineaceae bacterium]
MNRFEQLLAGALPTMLASVFLSGEPWVFTAFVAVTSVSALYLVVLGVRGAYRATERNITVRYQRDRRRQADARSANARLGRQWVV